MRPIRVFMVAALALAGAVTASAQENCAGQRDARSKEAVNFGPCKDWQRTSEAYQAPGGDSPTGVGGVDNGPAAPAAAPASGQSGSGGGPGGSCSPR